MSADERKMEASCPRAAEHTVFSGFEWIAIPHGYNPQTGNLRIGIRVVPKIDCKYVPGTGSCEEKKAPIRSLCVQEMEKSVLLDWPKFMERVTEIEIEVQSAGKALVPCKVSGDEIKQALERARQRHGVLSRELASEIWQQLVDPELIVRPQNISIMGIKDREGKIANAELTEPLPLNEAESADLIARGIGELLAAGIVKDKSVSGSSREAPLQKTALVSAEGKAAIANLRKLFAPTHNPLTGSIADRAQTHFEKEIKSRVTFGNDGDGQIKNGPDNISVTRLRNLADSILSEQLYTHPDKLAQGEKLATDAKGKDNPFGFSVDGEGALLKQFGLLVDRSYRKIVESGQKVDDLTASLVRRVLARMADSPSRKPTNCEEPEFHKLLAQLLFHPWLLEVLGLVMQIEVPREKITTKDVKELHLTVTKIAYDMEFEISPAILSTVVTDSVTFFPCERARPVAFVEPNACEDQMNNGSYYKGCVRLDVNEGLKPKYALEQLDIDHGFEKCIQVATKLQSKFDSGLSLGESEAEFPTMPTTGLSLLVRGNLGESTGTIVNGKSTITYYAHDLVVGYRPDISTLHLEERNSSCEHPWKSLVRRHIAGMNCSGEDLSRKFQRPLSADEGFVTPIARTIQTRDGNQQATISLGELFCWRGWSLAAPPIECSKSGLLGRIDVAPSPGCREIKISYKPDRGLPKQRVGWGYCLGLRVVYADGWSVPLEEASTLYKDKNSSFVVGASQIGNSEKTDTDKYFVPFFRNEPVLPPDVHVNSLISLDRALGLDPLKEEPKDHLIVGSLESGRVIKTATERVLVPPRVSLEQAIRLGMYDKPHLQRKAPQSAFRGVRLNTDGTFPGTDGKTYFVLSSSATEPRTPYLPDPWAKRLIIGIYRSADNHLLSVDYLDHYDSSHQWPDCKPLTIRLEAGTVAELPRSGFRVQWNRDTLVVRVRPGFQVYVRCWYEMGTQMLACSGVVEWMARYLCTNVAKPCQETLGLPNDCVGNSEDTREWLIKCLGRWHERFPDELPTHIAEGHLARDVNLISFQFLNPSVTLQLTHAVPIPIGLLRFAEVSDLSDKQVAHAPVLNSQIAQRFDLQRKEVGAQSAEYCGDIEFDRVSTESIECVAEWDDIDDERSCNVVRTGCRHLLILERITGILPMSDTKFQAHHPYRGTTFPTSEPPLDNDLLLLNGKRAQTGRRINDDEERIEKLRSNRVVDFKDTRAHEVKFTLSSVSRTSQLFSDRFKSERKRSDVICTRWVNSSQPPDPPKVAYVVPLFKWETQANGHTAHRRREGGWFRVWLERPWFSSGEGELFALVCWPPDMFDPKGGAATYNTDKDKRWPGSILKKLRAKPTDPYPISLNNLVTAWGRDPIWDVTNEEGLQHIPPRAFTNRLVQDPVKVVPFELSGTPVSPDQNVALALFKPERHQESCRWYVDIHIEPPERTYFPFVRLAMARYQPHSLPGCAISKIVTTEFVQLTPHRTASIEIIKDDEKETEVQVSVSGRTGQLLGASGAATMIARMDCYEGKFFAVPPHQGSSETEHYLEELARPRTWIPLHKGNGPEEVHLLYNAREARWYGRLRFEKAKNRAHSIYLEEREVILQDKYTEGNVSCQANGDANCLDGGIHSERVLYADRLLIQ